MDRFLNLGEKKISGKPTRVYVSYFPSTWIAWCEGVCTQVPLIPLVALNSVILFTS